MAVWVPLVIVTAEAVAVVAAPLRWLIRPEAIRPLPLAQPVAQELQAIMLPQEALQLLELSQQQLGAEKVIMEPSLED